MNAFDKFIELLQTTWEAPKLYGLFHILSLTVLIALFVIVCFTCRKLTDKKFRIIMAVIASVLIALEILKQLSKSYNPATGIWKYDWHYFPFQFCSVPMYIMVIIAACKESKFRDYLCAFMVTFGLFAGAVVMLYPSTVLTKYVFTSTQSMIHHGLMVIGAVVILVSGKVELKQKTIFKALAVFSVMVGIAFIANIVAHHLQLEDFDCFYIGPYERTELPLLNTIWDAMEITGEAITIKSFIFLAIYFVGFSLAGYIVLLIEILINKIACRKSKVNN